MYLLTFYSSASPVSLELAAACSKWKALFSNCYQAGPLRPRRVTCWWEGSCCWRLSSERCIDVISNYCNQFHAGALTAVQNRILLSHFQRDNAATCCISTQAKLLIFSRNLIILLFILLNSWIYSYFLLLFSPGIVF